MQAKTKKYLVIAGAAGMGLYLVSKFKGGFGGGKGSSKLAVAPVGAGEQVTASTYRVIKSRRPGLQYVQATGTVGGDISFQSPAKGTFTRNVVQEGNQLWAEIA